jgi:hypothetical protein
MSYVLRAVRTYQTLQKQFVRNYKTKKKEGNIGNSFLENPCKDDAQFYKPNNMSSAGYESAPETGFSKNYLAQHTQVDLRLSCGSGHSSYCSNIEYVRLT